MLTEIILCSIITVPLLFVLFENNVKKQLRLLDTHADYVKMKSMKDVTKTFVGENKMTSAQAKLELFLVDRQIEKKGVEYANELGQYNKSIVMDELQLLWDKKDILKKFI